MWRLVKRDLEGRQQISAAGSAERRSDSEAGLPEFKTPASTVVRRVGGLHLATLLFLFGACLVVPALGAMGWLLERNWRDQTYQIERRVEQVADDLANDIDRDLSLMAAVVTVLAGSPALVSGDFQTFHERATIALRPLGLHLLYRDLDGRQRLNTRLPWGSTLPVESLPEIDEAVRASRAPYISDIVVGAVARRPLVTLTAPVPADGELRGFLHMSIDPERLLAVMKSQRLPPEWNTGLSDRKGLIIARLLRHEDFVGKALPAELRAPRNIAFRIANVEGVEVIRASRVSALSGWLVSANVPVSAVRAAFIADVWSILGVGLFLILLVLALAAAAARMISRPIRDVARFAVMVEDERIPPVLRSPVREANEVAAALRLASERLHDRAWALRQALERFNVALRGADIVVFAQDRNRRLTWVSENAGYHRRDFLGRREEDLLPPESRAAAIELRERAFETGQPQEGEVTIGSNNEARHFRVRVEPVRELGGDMVGLLGVSTEVTAFRQEQQRNAFLVRELAHRSKNLLSVVQAIANETLRTGKSTDDFMERFGLRVSALAQLQDLVVSGLRGGIELGALVKSQLAPFAEVGSGRLSVEGPSVRLKPEAANAIGMALHELATNATKYGALSVPAGWISIAWRFEADDTGARRFHLGWREGGGPLVTPPERRGFGRTVVVDITAATLDGRVTLDFPPEGALWQVDAPAGIVSDS